MKTIQLIVILFIVLLVFMIVKKHVKGLGWAIPMLILGVAAAAKVLQDQGSSVKLTGLGLPSEMAEYIGADEAHACPYMFLWNPIDIGRLGAYTSAALVNGDIDGSEGGTFTAGDMGEYTVVAAGDGGTEIILGAPFKFDPSNIAEWAEVY